ncbi:hypothetical protein E2C01_024517 [Portunus trituberculatus]|uniref:Uncharacterized protein n=1 Tax=Portunus trituberculatus TaxID=210409 RepID=A0A5B7EAU7_PORTR|nr:hypothetical protein [Portunus trituberculatus]
MRRRCAAQLQSGIVTFDVIDCSNRQHSTVFSSGGGLVERGVEGACGRVSLSIALCGRHSSTNTQVICFPQGDTRPWREYRHGGRHSLTPSGGENVYKRASTSTRVIMSLNYPLPNDQLLKTLPLCTQLSPSHPPVITLRVTQGSRTRFLSTLE